MGSAQGFLLHLRICGCGRGLEIQQLREPEFADLGPGTVEEAAELGRQQKTRFETSP